MNIGASELDLSGLILAGVIIGASLPLLLLFILTDQSPVFVAKREIVATEIVRTLVGSIGLVASVPLTTWLAAYCFTLGESKQPKNGARVPHSRWLARSPSKTLLTRALNRFGPRPEPASASGLRAGRACNHR